MALAQYTDEDEIEDAINPLLLLARRDDANLQSRDRIHGAPRTTSSPTALSGVFDESASNRNDYQGFNCFTVLDSSSIECDQSFAQKLGAVGQLRPPGLFSDLDVSLSGSVPRSGRVCIGSVRSSDYLVFCFPHGEPHHREANTGFFDAFCATAQLGQPNFLKILSLSLKKVQTKIADERLKALSEAASVIVATTTHSTTLFDAGDWAILELLNSSRSKRIDDAVDLLCLLGRDAVRGIAQRAQKTFPPDGANDDYWYALIRAAGLTGDRSLSEQFVKTGRIALQEAAVEALGDVGDAAAIAELKTIANDSFHPKMIRELAEELAADLS